MAVHNAEITNTDAGGDERDERLQLALWFLAILSFGFGDTLTSLMLFQSGGEEANPLLAGVLKMVGPTVWGFLLIKTAATVGAMLLARVQRRLEKSFSLAMLGTGIYLVAQNTSTILRL